MRWEVWPGCASPACGLGPTGVVGSLPSRQIRTEMSFLHLSFGSGSDLLFSNLCKSSSPFEEDPNPWLGGEREKKEEEEAVKDYFLNITNSHHTTVSDDEHRVMMMLIHYKRYCPKIVIPWHTADFQVSGNNHTSPKVPEIIYNVTKVISNRQENNNSLYMMNFTNICIAALCCDHWDL